jgi:predicted outer membrane repeat protein
MNERCAVQRKMKQCLWSLVIGLVGGTSFAQDGSGSHAINLEGFAHRVHSQRCNLLLVGDSIATHFCGSNRGSWLTAFWREWKPLQWRGRFLPAAHHAPEPNGSWVFDLGRAPAADPNCFRLHGNGAVYPGVDLGADFGTGWWGNLVDAFEITGDLEHRRLHRSALWGDLSGRSAWGYYNDGGDWANGRIRATMVSVMTPNSLAHFTLRGMPAEGVEEWKIVNLEDQLPESGRRLVPMSIEFNNAGISPESLASVQFEVRSSNGHQELPGQGIFFLGTTFENVDRSTGLLIGAHAVGGDRTGCHLADGVTIPTEGVALHRFYDDDYLASFIEVFEWNTFVITAAANDLSGYRLPEDVVKDAGRIIERYRAAWTVAKKRNPALLDPQFLVISPQTCSSIQFEEAYRGYDALVDQLAGGDVAVIRLWSMFDEAYGSYSTWTDTATTDGIHPTEFSIRLMADLIWTEIESVLGLDGGSGPTHRVPAEHATIGEAVEACQENDRVVVSAGEYAESITVGLRGTEFFSVHGHTETRVVAPAGARAMYVIGKGKDDFPPVRVEGFDLNGSSSTSGGGLLLVDAAVELRECIFDGCSASLTGGGLAARSSSVSLRDVRFSNCSAQGDGGSIHLESSLLAIEDGIVADGFSMARGGGVFSENSFVVLNQTSVSNNHSGLDGGGLAMLGGIFSAEELQITNNVAGNATSKTAAGGGLFLAGNGVLTDVQFDGNMAYGDGGGMRMETTMPVVMDQIVFDGNTARKRGGALSFAGGTVTMEQPTITLCTAEDLGGGIHVETGVLEIHAALLSHLAAPQCEVLAVDEGELIIQASIFCPAEMSMCGNVVLDGSNEFIDECDGFCTGDLNVDGWIDGTDIGLFLVAWGQCEFTSYCRADIDRNGVVDGADLGLFLLELYEFPRECR